MRRILLFVEGEGDVSAAKILTQRIVTDSGVSDKICIDGAFRVASMPVCKRDILRSLKGIYKLHKSREICTEYCTFR